MLILGIESSCDDTAAALISDDRVVANLLTSQDLIHTRFGGVVPELASRQHLQAIHPIVQQALCQGGVGLEEVDLIAVTQGPGLIGSLLVGFCYAKALAQVSRIPLVGVDHMAGHILSIFLSKEVPDFPYISLIVSGGTSAIYLAQSFTKFRCLGRTRDDAAGEAFDKVAKLLGLSYPGGPHVAKLAASGAADKIKFPRSWLEENSLDFSFSGLKTSVMNYSRQERNSSEMGNTEDICASFEEAVVEVLVKKTLLAAQIHGIDSIAIGGGVAANSSLRNRFQRECELLGKKFYPPEPGYCTDNAAMIAFAGGHQYRVKGGTELHRDVYSRSPLS